MDLVQRISALATRIATEFNAIRSEMASLSGGGGGVSGTCTVTVNGYEHRETVALAGVTLSSKVFLSLAPHLDDDENDPEMLSLMHLTAIPATDAFDVVAVFSQRESGPIKLNYMVI